MANTNTATENYPSYLTEAEAARYLGMSRIWLRMGRSQRNPDTPPYAKFGRAVRYLREDLDRWRAERHVDPRQVFDQAEAERVVEEILDEMLEDENE